MESLKIGCFYIGLFPNYSLAKRMCVPCSTFPPMELFKWLVVKAISCSSWNIFLGKSCHADAISNPSTLQCYSLLNRLWIWKAYSCKIMKYNPFAWILTALYGCQLVKFGTQRTGLVLNTTDIVRSLNWQQRRVQMHNGRSKNSFCEGARMCRTTLLVFNIF